MIKFLIGTALRCDSEAHNHHGQPDVMAVADPYRGVLEVKHRRHGTFHERDFTLTELVTLLDPAGTTFKPVKGTA